MSLGKVNIAIEKAWWAMIKVVTMLLKVFLGLVVLNNHSVIKRYQSKNYKFMINKSHNIKALMCYKLNF